MFEFDTRDSAGTTEAVSGVFGGLDARNLGNVASDGSAEFVLDTLGGAPTNLEIVGPSTVLAGSQTDYKLIWHAGTSNLDVTAGARWRSVTNSPGNPGMVQATLYAGETHVPATVRIVGSYQAITGQSKETAPFTITITPRMLATLTAARLSSTTGVVHFNTGVQGAQGTVVVNWDLDGDGQFDDATGETVTRDYGTWTGTSKVKVEVIDGQGHRRIEERSVVLNKPPVANQPVPVKPANDPTGFSLLLPDQARSPFVFNAGGRNRRDSGLVVIAHGLYSSAREDWVREMGAAVESRCDSAGIVPPDIALLDWSDLAGDPAELSEAQKWMLKNLIVAGLKTRNYVMAGTGAAGEAINFGFDLYAVKQFGLTTGQMLANWIYLNSRVGAAPQIDPDKPIHLIGHSAGGFVVGEAARLLKHPLNAAFNPVHVDRVTMLDTPFVVKEHIAAGADGFPNPGTVERYVSAVWGSLAFGWPVSTNSYYRYENIWTAVTPGYNLISHGDSHNWYTRKTIWNAGDEVAELKTDGFHYSPIINASTRISKPYTPPQAAPAPRGVPPPAPAPPLYPDIVPSGWETFGNASTNGGTWTLTELDDAGIWKDLTLPVTAATLEFDFHFLTAGDGDFLAVHFGDNPVLYQGLDLSLSRDAWIPAEIPLELLPQDALSGKLVFTLVSRGGVNAQVQLRNIRITQAEDVDGDGLAATDESASGCDARNPDTDADGISDGDEVNTYNTRCGPIPTATGRRMQPSWRRGPARWRMARCSG